MLGRREVNVLLVDCDLFHGYLINNNYYGSEEICSFALLLCYVVFAVL